MALSPHLADGFRFAHLTEHQTTTPLPLAEGVKKGEAEEWVVKLKTKGGKECRFEVGAEKAAA